MKEDSQKRVDEAIYKINLPFAMKVVFLGFVTFIISFIISFPVKKTIKANIDKVLMANRSCPMSYKDLNLKAFPPSISLTKLNVSKRCLNRNGNDLMFSKVVATLGLPSFSPIGPTINVDLFEKSSKIDLSLVPGLGDSLIKVNQSKISTKTLNNLLGKGNLLSGNITAQGNLLIAKNKIKNGDILLKSKNFAVNDLEVSNFKIPPMNIGKLLLKLKANGNNLKVDNFILGRDEEGSPLNTQFKGTVKLNPKSFGSSNYTLTGQFKLGKQILKEISVLEMFLPKEKRDASGHYSVKLTGRLSSPPRPQFIK